MAKKCAILIGINQYESSSLNNLKYAKADAEAMKRYLEREGSFDPNEIFLFTEDSPIHHHRNISTKVTFCNLIFFFNQQFKRSFLKREDQLWFFFSGHGIRGADEDYLIPSDGHPEEVNRTAIAVNYITEKLRESGAGNIVMFLDACRYETAHKGTTFKLENYQGIITFYSCSAGQRSYEIDKFKHGAFTYVLLEALQKNKWITVSELEQYLMEKVPHHKTNQRPLASIQPIGKKDLHLLSKPPNTDTNKAPDLPKKPDQQNQEILQFIKISVVITIVMSLGAWVWSIASNCPAGQARLNGICTTLITNPNDLSERFSSGEHTLLKNFYNNPALDLGTRDFVKKNYEKARLSFKQAVKIEKENHQQYHSPINPEPQIYLNNTLARLKENHFALAVVVTASGLPLEGPEMLRGIADAQTEFNSSGGFKGRLLEIVIVNDDNDPDTASKVAQKIADNKNILGVIGHHTSESSKAGIPKYEKAGLAMVSPLSTSSDLSSRVFLRTVASTKETAKKLSDYAKANNINKVAIFYNSDSESVYSKSMYEDFVNTFRKTRVVDSIDIEALNDQDNKVKTLQGKVDAIVLFPQAELNSFNIAYNIAQANSELPPEERMKLLGGNSLYRNEILTLWKDTSEELVLVVPWFADTQTYAKKAEKEWGGRIGWRTATSYDATQAFIEALRLSVKETGDVTRASLLEKLKSVKLLPSKTSGEELSFSDSGNREKMTPALVKVVKKGNNLTFEKIP